MKQLIHRQNIKNVINTTNRNMYNTKGGNHNNNIYKTPTISMRSRQSNGSYPKGWRDCIYR